MQTASYEPIFAIGLMSGTSADGIDAALVRTDGDSCFEFIAATTISYDLAFRDQLIRVASSDVPLDQLLEIEQELTMRHVDACRQLMTVQDGPTGNVSIVGFHGHTIRHDALRRLTWQLGDAAYLSEKLRCAVVSDFRRRDIAAGGHGAPLAALFHRQLFADCVKPLLVLNIGGVANITYVDDGQILAGDTGPGCGLLDALARGECNQRYDRDGQLARQGKVSWRHVDQAMQHPFFAQTIPKSADRFDFNSIDMRGLNAADAAATLCAITVAGITTVVDKLPRRPVTVWVAGGGVHHPVIMTMLGEKLTHVASVESAGFRSDSLEAECFAWLAVRRLRGLPTSLPTTTGCAQATSGGLLTAMPVA